MPNEICQNPNCNKQYQKSDYRQKFCSRSCSATMSNLKSPKRRARLGKCKYCKIEVINTSRRSVCDKCLKNGIHSKEQWSSKKLEIENRSISEVKALWKTNNRPWTDAIRTHARRNFPSIGKICKCGYSKHTEVCHIKPITSFPDTALIKDINCIENIEYLCPNCHWELDNL